jgi:hypothetical protein
MQRTVVGTPPHAARRAGPSTSSTYTDHTGGGRRRADARPSVARAATRGRAQSSPRIMRIESTRMKIALKSSHSIA